MKMYLLSILLSVSLVNANLVFDQIIDDYKDVKDSFDFTGKVVLVTGSSSGIGETTIKLFAALGAQVVVTGRNEEAVQNVTREVLELSPKKLKPLGVVADVTKSDDLSRLLNETIKTFGKLDVLVNNAGIIQQIGIKDKRYLNSFDQQIAINLKATVELTYLAIPYLEETNGTIISTSSDLNYIPEFSGFSMSKAAVNMFTELMAIELGPKIRVNAISPGIIDNGHRTAEKIKQLQPLINRTPLKRQGLALDVARGILFLASTNAQFITGANIKVDGGLMTFSL